MKVWLKERRKMLNKIFVLVLLLSVIGCAQTWLPGWVKWEYDYTQNQPPENDSLNIIFDVFYLESMVDTSFTLLDSTQAHQSRLLTHDFLYTNQYWYLFCRARSLVDGSVSLNSDTVQAWFPRIIEGTPYQLQVLQTKLP